MTKIVLCSNNNSKFDGRGWDLFDMPKSFIKFIDKYLLAYADQPQAQPMSAQPSSPGEKSKALVNQGWKAKLKESLFNWRTTYFYHKCTGANSVGEWLELRYKEKVKLVEDHCVSCIAMLRSMCLLTS